MNLDTYRDLFVHRSDVYAVQSKQGHYMPAGIGHMEYDNTVKPEEGHWVYDEYWPLTDDEIAEHLAGFASYGVYVIDPLDQYCSQHKAGGCKCEPTFVRRGPNTVSYLVFDLDTYSPEAYEHLVYCLNCLVQGVNADYDSDGVPRGGRLDCLLMENSGGKGFHAWLFLSEPLPAAQVRRWVAKEFTPMWSERSALFDGTPLEIFPKQDEVAEGAFGNLVKLPLGTHAKSGRKSEFVPCQGWASDVDSVQRLDSSLIPDIPREEVSAPNLRSGSGQGSNPAPFACISQIIEDGAPQGCRDKAMFHFAHYASGTGLPEDLVEEWCERVNEGFSPPLRLNEVRTKVRSASAMNAPHPGCNADWLRGFCPGGERCFAPWNEDKPARAGTVEVAESYLDMTPEQRREARLRRE